MSNSEQISLDPALGHEGPTLIDFQIEYPQFELGINGPKLLFTSLELRTSLYLQDGCDYAALRQLVDGFKATAFCGHSPPVEVEIRIVGSTLAPYVSIDVGPPSMYMSHIVFETVGKETFAELCDRTLNPLGRSRFLVALVPIVNEGIGHDDHHSRSLDHAFIPMSSAEDAPIGLESRRPKYRIEYVLQQKRGNN